MAGNDNEPLGIECEVLAMPDHEYLVEAVNHGSEGEIYRTIFSCQDARSRALTYAAAEYGHNGILMSPPSARPPKSRPATLTVVANADTTERQLSPRDATQIQHQES